MLVTGRFEIEAPIVVLLTVSRAGVPIYEIKSQIPVEANNNSLSLYCSIAYINLLL